MLGNIESKPLTIIELVSRADEDIVYFALKDVISRVDGFQIRVLVYTMIYRLMPKLLEAGVVYIAETPLFEIETNKGSRFAYTVQEKDKMLVDLAKEGVSVININRSKGLGENTPEMLSLTTMAPETRKLSQIKFDPNDALVSDVTNMLFGSDPTDERKQFIFDYLGQEMSDAKDTIDAITVSDEEDTETVGE